MNFSSQKIAAAFLAAAFTFFTGSLFAGSATWDASPGSGDWNTAGNWTPATVPNGPSDTATFDLTNNAAVSLSANTEVNGITFNATASAYTISASPTFTLTISGVGVTNNSGTTQNFVTIASGVSIAGTIEFENSATAGSNTVYTNNGGAVSNANGGLLQFLDTSTAGSATINNNGATAGGAFGGATRFYDSSMAGSAAITNYGSTSNDAAAGSTTFNDTSSAGSATISNYNAADVNGHGGETYFNNTSTASSATITNGSGDYTGGDTGRGYTTFSDTSTAGSATINNNGATVSGAFGGQTNFNNTSTAGSATITNNGGTVSGALGGETDFNNTSTAGSATINDSGGTVNGAGGGLTSFSDTSTAGSATINNNAAAASNAGVGLTNFHDSSTAGSATINNDGASANADGGVTEFYDSSTAGSAAINNTGGTANGAQGGGTVFLGTSNAGSSTIDNNGGTFNGADGGDTEFFSTSSASSATINNNGATDSNATAGETDFLNSSTAGSATINNNAATVSGAHGGETDFSGTSTAGSATITNDGASSDVSAGSTTFFNSSTADSATITNNGGTDVLILGGNTLFKDTSTAGSAIIINNGGTVSGAFGGYTAFSDTSTAGSATITNNSATVSGEFGGETDFGSSSTAGSANITNNAGTVSSADPGSTLFINTSTAGSATITNKGATVSGAGGGDTIFDDTSTAGSATITNNGATVSGAFGGTTFFDDTSIAGSATLIANGGTAGGGGGGIFFESNSDGGTSRIEVFGNGEMDISFQTTGGVTIGSLEGSGNVFLGANQLTVGSNNASTIFSGVIQDGGIGGGTGGSLTKTGTGMLTLSGNNSYTGDTNIEGGVLAAGSLHALGTGSVFILNGGATLQTANGPRTFDVGGNYVQATGTLSLQIGGTNSGVNSDLMAVTGTANLNAGTPGFTILSLHRINNFMPLPGDMVTIITAGGGRINTFSLVNNDFPGLLQPHVIYDPNDVMVEFLLGSFNIGGLTPNQKSVAHNLDNAASDPAAAPLINFLVLEPLGSLPHDYDLIAPEELASIYEIGFSQAVVQNDNLQRRMDDIRAGSNGFCANGFVPQVSGKDYSKDSDGKGSLPDKSTRDVYTPAPDNRWGVFVTGTGDFVNVGNDDSNAPGYDITTGDVTVGADYRLCNNFAIGIDAGYSRSTADLVDDGRVDVDGGKVGAYATVFGKGLFGSKFYVDGAVGGGFNSYDTRRTGLQDEPVRGSTDGSEFNAMISYGSDWTFGCFNIGTWSSVQYTNVSIDQFTETGSLAPLIIQDQDENSFRATTGLHASYDIKAGHFIFRPELRAAYQHEYCDQAYQVDSQLASGAGTVFRVRGPDIGRDAALVGTGMSMQWNNRLSTYVYYDGVLGRNNYDNNAVSGGFRIGF